MLYGCTVSLKHLTTVGMKGLMHVEYYSQEMSYLKYPLTYDIVRPQQKKTT